jgi:hypothetical protein
MVTSALTVCVGEAYAKWLVRTIDLWLVPEPVAVAGLNPAGIAQYAV